MVPLEASKLFLDVPASELRGLDAIAQEQTFESRQVIFKEGDPGDGLYIVKDGTVEISATMGYGESRLLSRLAPGELFGEMAVLDNDPRSATAIAAETTTVYFISRAALLQLMAQAPSLSTALVREISRRLRDFNRQYIQEALESERLALVGRFASSIVHDLKNPLSIIGISADLACMPDSKPEMREISRVRIRKQVERIVNMVNELLEFARGSQTPFVMAAVDYAGFVHQLVEEIRPEIAHKSVVIKLENDPPSVKVRLNPPRLSRVFHNFISNSIDAMPSGGLVTVRFSKTDREVITEVQDTGKGIAPQIVDRLFQAFSSYGKAHGTGLGLSISKKIILDHQGRVFARNAPEGGAIFGFALPIQPE